MKTVALSITAASVALIGSVSTASAGLFDFLFPPRPRVVSVPEIDASTGLVAAAAILAATAFVWERNRRHAKAAQGRDLN